jgi:hypothetical protein
MASSADAQARDPSLLRRFQSTTYNIIADVTPRARRKKALGEYAYAKDKVGRTWGGDPHYDPRKDRFYREWVRILANQP